MALNYDILMHIAGYLEADEDYGSLYQCSLVNKAMNQAISKVLYHKVVLAPPPTNVFRLGRQDQELTPVWKSACLPHNSTFVLELEVTGFLVQRPLPQNNFSNVLCDSIRNWENLQSVTLAPKQYHQDVFKNALSALKKCQHLRRVTVNQSCCDETGAPLLTQLDGLTSLTLENPTRMVLQMLPDWLSRLAPGLTALYLMENCGSVTPGVLKACVQQMSGIRSFALGLSYSVANDDAFSFLDQLSSISSLDFRYYLQLRAPSVRPDLPALRSLTVRHASFTRLHDAGHLTKWIRHLSARCPLEEFKLIADPRTGPNINLDGLLDHLSFKHGETLRILKMSRAFVGITALRNLCSRCKNLEVIALGTSASVVEHLRDILSPCSNLHTVTIFTPNMKASKMYLDTSIVSALMEGVPCLRRFTLNDKHWEGSWTSNEAGAVTFGVREWTATRSVSGG